MAESAMFMHDSEYVELDRPVRPVILAVDDDQGVQESFRVILEEQYDVLGALDGTTALDIVNSCSVDLVLLDLRLPGMHGIEALARMKAVKPQLQVIVVTAIPDVRTVVQAMQLGAFSYLTKPFDTAELLSVVQHALANPARAGQPTADPPALGEHVLLVGTVLGPLITLKLALEPYCATTVAGSATAALLQLSNHPSTLLVVHDSLPSTDGNRLLRVARSPACPIILISSGAVCAWQSPEFLALPTYTLVEDPQRFTALMLEIVTLLSLGAQPRPRPSFGTHVTKALCYIGRHYAEDLTVKTLAAEVGVSEGHLAHLFPTEVQITVKEFVTAVRVDVAKQLLSDPAHTLDTIAEMVGFSDASHLSRVFLHFTGRRPRDYRREIITGLRAILTTVL